jgi:hypothetical protein
MSQIFRLVTILAFAGTLGGCVAAVIPAVLISNMVMKEGTATILIDGADGAHTVFRSAVVSKGAIIEVNDPDLSRAEFAQDRVFVTLQKVRPGRYALVGSSSTQVARSWAITDSIALRTQEVAEAMENDGYVIVDVQRDRGLPSFGKNEDSKDEFPAVTEERVLDYGAVTTDMVRSVQAMLNDNGYDAGAVDGLPGKRTSKALAAYQIDNGLSVTNGITAEAYRQLFPEE